MKTFILLTALTTAFYSRVQAQCTPSIPSNAVVISSIDTINGGFDPVWVCKGDSFHTGGGIFNIYLESGAFMSTSGGIDSIFVENGATLVMNGGIHHIIYEKFTDLTLAGGIPTLDSCSGLFFNYSKAPSNGCFSLPLASFQSSDTTLCAGTCIDYTDMSFHASAWQWSFPGAVPATDTVQNPLNICYQNPGNYDVTLIISDSIGSDTLHMNSFISVNPDIAVTSTQNGNMLSVSSGFFSYQWYLDTMMLNGEINDTLIASLNGNYIVHVTDSNGCDTMVSFTYLNPGLSESISDFEFSIAPNPARSLVTIRLNQRFDGKIEIYDMWGKSVLSTKLNKASTEISIKHLASGIYFIRMFSGSSVTVNKLVVE